MKSFLTRIIILSFLFILVTINPLQAATEQRIALVIGNSAYSSGPLKNPVNDATDITATLQRLGFSVIIKKNAKSLFWMHAEIIHLLAVFAMPHEVWRL